MPDPMRADAALAAAAGAGPMRALQDWVRTAFGISYAKDASLFESRVAALCREFGGDAASWLERAIAGDRTATIRLAEAVSTNHTLFFREDEIFGLVASEILPRMPDGQVRMWSAAASSGDEAYSLAITAFEVYGPAAAARVRVLGTDLSERQVRAAEHGAYPMLQLRQLSPERRQRWFRAAGLGQFQVSPELRALCTFRRMNLTTAPWPFEQRFHLIFLRNVLYYFEPSMRRQIVEACFDVAEPGAWLVTSLTEPMLDIATRWTAIRPAVFRRGPG